jgi:sensor histidine kinase YesM
MTPPAPGRPYWICQAAGWGGFLAYVLAGYELTEHPKNATDIISIVFFNAGVCPLLTHGLRRWMYVHDWHQMPAARRLPRLIGVVVGFSLGLTAAVVLALVLAGQPMMPAQGAFGIAGGFAMGFTGWLTIYFSVHARRERDALQLQLRVTAREAQLQSLRAQINPHFLFNCLNSLRHLIVTEPARAEVMVTGLAELLRYSLNSDRTEFVPLAGELRIVDEYLNLERVRLEDRLTVERRIAPDALRVEVPPMIVQTLVENAIKHGIADLPGGGVVRIEAAVVDAQLVLSVVNTGRLRPAQDTGGFGLDNAKGRLQLIYGAAASLSLTEHDGKVEARLSLPITHA